MSNFSQMTKHPDTGQIEMADWLDDYFGRHRYGVMFADGEVFPESQIEPIESVDVYHAERPAEVLFEKPEAS